MIKNVTVDGITSSVYFADTDGNIYSEREGNLVKMKVYITHDGYRRVKLGRDLPTKHYRICRIIAETFLEKEDGKPIVNHKNGIRDDDRLENLEWCDNSYNQKQRFKNTLGTKAKRVEQIDARTGDVIKVYDSPIYAFKETGIQAQNIAKVCRGERKRAGGFFWRYADYPSVETIERGAS